MQKEFMGCVEVHLDPPEDTGASYRVEAVYRCEDEASALPGDAVRFVVAVDETDPDISERRHSIEFLSLDKPEEPVGRLLHSMKRIEAGYGHFLWTESQFQVHAPDAPTGQAPQEQVEHELKGYIDRIKALDRARKLVELEP